MDPTRRSGSSRGAFETAEVPAELSAFSSETDGPGVVACQAKSSSGACSRVGIDMTGLRQDVGVAAYLLDPSTGQYSLEALAETYLGMSLAGNRVRRVSWRSTSESRTTRTDGDPQPAGGRDGRCSWVRLLEKRIAADGITRLHDEVERPLTRVLARMEVAGVAVDIDELRSIAADLSAQCDSLEAEIHRLAGETST